MENYKNLDTKACREEFNKYPSFSILDDIYPLALKQIYNPPVLLFYQGDLELLEKSKLAVVGTRNASKMVFSQYRRLSKNSTIALSLSVVWQEELIQLPTSPV